jgi:protein arginine kinase activator
MLKQMHKGVQHIGKVPKVLRAKLDTTKQRDRLNEQLQKAIETENYEEAARLRDQLKELEAIPVSKKEE